MTQEEKVACFVSKLNPRMNTRLQALRLTTFADVLDSGRPIKEEVAKPTSKESKPQQPKENPKSETPTRKRKAKGPPPRNQSKLSTPTTSSKRQNVSAYAYVV